jgi:hypothetical protein
MDQRIELLERTSCGVVDEVQLPSARMWGIMEGQKRHEGWFKALRWEEVQNEKRGKATWKDIQGELKVKTKGNVWVHPKLNETPPHQRDYLFNHTYVIMHCIFLTGFCENYDAINKFLVYFWRRINAAGQPNSGTRAFTVYEMRQSFERHMKYFEEMTKKWKLHKPLGLDEPTDWTSMLAACGSLRRTSLADLRESLTPRQMVYQTERTPKGGKKGDRGAARKDTKKGGGKKGKKSGGKGNGGVQKKVKAKQVRWQDDREPQPVKRKEQQDEKKNKPPKSEIPCVFFKKGKCNREKCEYKH